MKKKLPYICITSVGNTYEEKLDSLIRIEPVLVMLGYNKPNEAWNNHMCKIREPHSPTILTRPSSRNLGYHYHNGSGVSGEFPATQLNDIINYVLNYKHNGK